MQILEKTTAAFPRIKVSYEPASGEEWPMTFQVGMSCAEGIILASDRQMTTTSGVRTSYKTSKIEYFENENMAFCSAGDDFCVILTKVIREQMAKIGFAGRSYLIVKEALNECVTIAWSKEREDRERRKALLRREPHALTGGNTLVVLREPGAVRLWSIDTTREFPNTFRLDMNECLPVGDAQNPTIFFLSRYFGSAPKTIKGLLPLAVHTMLMAENEYVSGLEIGIFTQSRFEVLRDEELQETIAKSQQLDSHIADMLGITNSKTTS